MNFVGIPILVQRLTNSTAVSGSYASLRCGSWAIPSNITYGWTKDGTALTVNSTRFTYYDLNSTLIIQNVVKGDAGRYRCQPSNAIGNGELTEAYLEVFCK